jgi:hypothetical protein
VLERVDRATRTRRGRPVFGHGWDEALLAEGRPPSRPELDRASAGGVVYLSRVDVHSAVVSSALAAAAGAVGRDGWDDSGRVERDAHHAVRAATREQLGTAARRDLQRVALRAAAAAGIACVHEMSAPHIAPVSDLATLLALASDAEALPEVVAYRGQLVGDVDEAHTLLDALLAQLPGPLAGLAGDLNVDGSVGSRTAAFREPYADEADGADHHGHLYLSVDQIRDHVATCTRIGVRAGFHVIGDAAVDAVLRGVRRAAEQVGIAAVRGAGHRLEHLEALDGDQLAQVRDLGLTASVQPAFDAEWGGDDGMYARRLGRERALAMNPFADLVAAGVPVAFGSDSPVTAFDPWGAVRAAAQHHAPHQRMSTDAAFAAHTVGGRRAAGDVRPEAGTLRPGAPATFAAWDLTPVVEASGAYALPDLASSSDAAAATSASPTPPCLLTVGLGVVLHRAADHLAPPTQ